LLGQTGLCPGVGVKEYYCAPKIFFGFAQNDDLAADIAERVGGLARPRFKGIMIADWAAGRTVQTILVVDDKAGVRIRVRGYLERLVQVLGKGTTFTIELPAV
jgi:hypothetical protein